MRRPVVSAAILVSLLTPALAQFGNCPAPKYVQPSNKYSAILSQLAEDGWLRPIAPPYGLSEGVKTKRQCREGGDYCTLFPETLGECGPNSTSYCRHQFFHPDGKRLILKADTNIALELADQEPKLETPIEQMQWVDDNVKFYVESSICARSNAR